MAVRYMAQLAVDFPTGWPVPELLGAQGTVVYAGTSNPAPISEDEEGSVPIPGGILEVTGQNMVPGFWLQGDPTDELEFISGGYRCPLVSLAGVAETASWAWSEAEQARIAADASAQAAEDAAEAAERPTDEAVAAVLTNPDSSANSQVRTIAEAAAVPVAERVATETVADNPEIVDAAAALAQSDAGLARLNDLESYDSSSDSWEVQDLLGKSALRVNPDGSVEIPALVAGTPSEVIAPDRLPPNGWRLHEWRDPAPGQWEVVDVTDHGIVPNDTAGITVAVLNILNNTSDIPYRKLYFPEGEYWFKSDFLPAVSNVQIVGDGKGRTILHLDSSGTTPISFGFMGGRSGTPVSVDGGLSRWASHIPLSNPAGFAAGDVVAVYTPLHLTGSGNEYWGQVSHVSEVTRTGIIIDPSLGIEIPASETPVVERLNVRRNVRVADVTIERDHHTLDRSSNIVFSFVENGAAHNVESAWACNEHILAEMSIDIDVRGCDLHDAYDYGGPESPHANSAYGFSCRRMVTRFVGLNCKIWNVRHHVGFQQGANHCVAAYNSCEAEQGGNTAGSVICHGYRPHNNLFEGNKGVTDFVVDQMYTPDGPGNTFFRNLVGGRVGIVWADNETAGTNIIGNVAASMFLNGTDNYAGANLIDGVANWGEFAPDVPLPASLAFDGRPGFLAGKPWPIYGPGVSEWGQSNTLPAEDDPRPA